MVKRQSIVMAGDIPGTFLFSNIRLYLCVIIFVTLNILIPSLFHAIHPLAGPVFKPMFFLVLMSGLMLGWRGGLMVGLLTPLVSYGISGMPLMPVLPRILIEAASLGFTAGFLRENNRGNLFLPLLGALALSLVITASMIFILSGGKTNGVLTMWQASVTGWPGLVLQITLLPSAIRKAESLLERRR